MTHAKRALAHIKKIYPDDHLAIEDVEAIIILLDAIEQTREQPPERKVPQPLTDDELKRLEIVGDGWHQHFRGCGLGLYYIKDVEAYCK